MSLINFQTIRPVRISVKLIYTKFKSTLIKNIFFLKKNRSRISQKFLRYSERAEHHIFSFSKQSVFLLSWRLNISQESSNYPILEKHVIIDLQSHK